MNWRDRQRLVDAFAKALEEATYSDELRADHEGWVYGDFDAIAARLADIVEDQVDRVPA